MTAPTKPIPSSPSRSPEQQQADGPAILGLHHVTAIAGDPQKNVNFYAGVLGLRLVKLTVNYDDPATYHLYYGDGQGHPGTILTFFPWPGAMRGRAGTGQLTTTSFAVPEKSLEFWKQRLQEHEVKCEHTRSLFDEDLLSFADPDGLQLEVVSTSHADPDRSWQRGPVPPEYAIRGFHHVTVTENGYERTASLLLDTLGFRVNSHQQNRFRYTAGGGQPGTIVDLLCAPEGRPGRIAVETVHHVAWRTPTDQQQLQWREIINAQRFNVTPVIDRTYFHSIYFHEPGGVLFEIATDFPGFAVDESADRLGSTLVLPSWLEDSREQLTKILPPLQLPTLTGDQADAVR